MLNQRPRQQGFTLIELLISVTILAGLMALAAPSFSTWLTNVRIRGTAESIMSGLNYAKSEAASRNTTVRFQLTTSLGANCQLSTSGVNWVVDVFDSSAASDSVVNACNTTPVTTGGPYTTFPAILQTRPSTDGSGTSSVTASVSNVIFNGIGRITPTPTANITIDVGNSSSTDSCASTGGNLACMRIVVTPTGQIQMCNPKIAAGSPLACP